MFDTLNSQMDLFSDNSGRYLLGKVVANQDPLNQDRIQVRVPGTYDPDQGEIPWVGPVKVSPFGIGATWGVYGVPAVGSDVLILLQDGDPQYPLYMSAQVGSNPDFPSGTCWGFQDPYGNKLKVTNASVVFTSHDGVMLSIAGGNCTVIATSTTVTSPNINLNGAVHINGGVDITGGLAVTGSMTNAGVNVGGTHVHGGIQAGGSNSAVPH